MCKRPVWLLWGEGEGGSGPGSPLLLRDGSPPAPSQPHQLSLAQGEKLGRRQSGRGRSCLLFWGCTSLADHAVLGLLLPGKVSPLWAQPGSWASPLRLPQGSLNPYFRENPNFKMG